METNREKSIVANNGDNVSKMNAESNVDAVDYSMTIDEDEVVHSTVQDEPSMDDDGEDESVDVNNPNGNDQRDDDDEDSKRTRRSLRMVNTKTPNTNEQQKRAPKRKSMSSGSLDTINNKFKIPRYEFMPVNLEAKTIVLGSSNSENYIIDRARLTRIPPKEGLYGVGDLIWTKMPGYPWWPCMITIDPVTGTFSKISGTSYKADRVYHVQYFGSQPYRGWSTVGMIMPFEGYEKYRQKIEDELKDLEGKKKKAVENKYIVKSSIQKKWNESIAEAEEALALKVEDRLNLLNFNYVIGSEMKTPRQKTGSNSKLLIGSSSKMTNSSKKVSEDVYDFDDDDDGFDNATLNPSLMFRNRTPKGDFNVYVKRHFDEEKKENPGLSNTEIIARLKEKWDKMDEKFRSIYVERKAIYEDESNMIVSKRANFDDEDYNDSDLDYDSDRNNGFDNNLEMDGQNNSLSTPVPNIQVKSKRKSKKSEKLFDKIKNDDSTSNISNNSTIKNTSNIVDNGNTSTPTTRKSRIKFDLKNNDRTIKNETPKVKKTLDKSTKISSVKKIEKANNNIINKVDNQILADDSDEAVHSDASSTKVKKPKPENKFCHQCGDEESEKSPKDILAKCSGTCGRMYHLRCNKDTTMIPLEDGAGYICHECKTGKYKCFACWNPNDLDTKKCEDKKCNKYYHLSCIENYPIKVNESANTFICPLHSCVNCHLLSREEDVRPQIKNKLVQCIRCPIAFHSRQACIGAGTVEVNGNYVICSEHYEEFNTNRNNRHLNVNYCFACIKVGNLICCERCPAAFHEECLDYTFDHEKSFYCSDCLLHKQLHYGDIVWVKLGQFRWWPGMICNPNQAPKNVIDLKHKTGEFPVYFFGSHDYYWVNRGRTFSYVEGDNIVLTSSTGKSSNKLTNSFKLALKEASKAFEEWKISSADLIKSMVTKPGPYQLIHSNKYLTTKNNQNDSNNHSLEHVCLCKKEATNPCSDEDCLNRVSLIECDPKTCPAGEKCQNQRFRKCEYAKCKPFRTNYAGWGLIALEDIKKDQFVIEYCGEIIDEKEYEKRLEKMNNNFYFLTIDKDNIIDAGPKGNLARFMNHSCDPNCITQKWVVNNLTRVGIFALKDIPAGTELTFNYNFDCLGNERIECKCNTAKCSGFLGSRPKQHLSDNDNNNQQKRSTNGSNNNNNNKQTSTTNGKVNKNSKELIEQNMIMHEKACFKCGEGGEMMVHCHQCPKSYHKACLAVGLINNDDNDGKEWICPRHKCMINSCTEDALIFCSVCPNSLCNEHATKSNNLQLPDKKFLCSDHRISDDDGLITAKFSDEFFHQD